MSPSEWAAFHNYSTVFGAGMILGMLAAFFAIWLGAPRR